MRRGEGWGRVPSLVRLDVVSYPVVVFVSVLTRQGVTGVLYNLERGTLQPVGLVSVRATSAAKESPALRNLQKPRWARAHRELVMQVVSAVNV